MKIVRNISILLFSLWSIWAMGQTEPTEVNWSNQYHKELQQIQKLEEQGQNRSAYIKAEAIFDQAISDLNIPGIIESMSLLIENIYRVDDEAIKSVLIKIGTLESSHPVVRAVIDSYLAELLAQYYERHRYQISQVAEQRKLSWAEIERWSASQMELTTDSLYSESVKADQLKEISSENIKTLLEQDPGDVKFELRPRIFDLLQERYVRFLQNNRFHWSPRKEVTDHNAVDLLTFQDLSDYIDTHDKESKIYDLISAFDQWEGSLKKTSYQEAYIDVLLQRINYVANYLDNKYLPASISLLETLNKDFSTVRNHLAIIHTLANLQFRQENHAMALKTLQTGLAQKTDNAYQNNVDRVRRLIRTIKAPELNVQLEEAYPSGQQPLTSIHFRNLDKVRLELYPLSTEEFIRWRFSDSRGEMSDFDIARSRNIIWEKTIDLPESHDYKTHRTETLINRNLNKGAYALRYWYKKDTLNLSGLVLFQVTNLTLIRASELHNRKLYVMDRRTGEKCEDAKVEAITIVRHPQFKNLEIRIIPEEEAGSFILPDKQLNQYYKVSQGNDLYISPLTYQNNVHHSQVQPFQRTVLLTDRAVYKPGQTIHFKALAVLSRQLDTELLKNQKIDLSLRNANGKEVWQKTYHTDEWGTVTGTVPIPASGLKGNWSLQASPSGQTRIQVEAYQRPNFEVTIPDSSITRQDSLILIEGEAKTYHGFPVQGGQGEVRVELQRRYWFYGIRPENTEVIHTGTFQTDEEGNFHFAFEGVEPPESPNRFGSFYFYSIHISVHAPSGEIREVTRTIPLDPDKIQIRIDYPTFQMLDDLSPVRFSVKNALQEPDSQRVDIQVSRLEAPEVYKVDRHWALPDQSLLTAAQFQNKIDHLFYNHEAKMDDWATLNLLKSWSQKLEDGDTLDLNNIFNQPGYYRLLVTSSGGDTLSTSSFGIGNSKKNFSIVHDAIEIMMSSQTAQPGETIRLAIFTPEETKGGKILISRPNESTKIYDLEDEDSIEIEIDEKDRGGIHVRAFGYLANRYYEKSLFVDVPWTNKELKITGIEDLSDIEVNTDTSLNINVVNHDKIGIKAEVAVAIYDASLDAYVPHDWTFGQSLFRNFSNPLSLTNISEPLGSQVTSKNNYWEGRYRITPIILPQLPHLALGFMHLPYARRDMKNMMVTGYAQQESMESSEVVDGFSKNTLDDEMDQTNEAESQSQQIRKDFAETLLFYGKAMTDSTGKVKIPFHTNDKAGRWKILVFAHTQDLSTGVLSHTFETHQDLFLESYLPQMVRQGDEMDLTFTLFNNAEKVVSGQVQFEMKPLFPDENTMDYKKNLGFDLEAGKSIVLSLPVTIDGDVNGPLIFTARVVDDTGKVWDATEEVVPVYPSSEVIYDGNVVILKEGENWSGEEANVFLHKEKGNVTIRIVQNMYSELLKSIPFLQYSNPVTTDQFFHNGVQALLGQYATREIPNFEKIYREWKRKGELKSRLAQNQDKKYVSLEHTPWVRQSDSGTEQMALLGLYFDESHMDQVIESNLTNWIQSQNEDGGFPWIKDGPSSFYMTVHFLAQWNKMEWAGISTDIFTKDDRRRALEYVDSEFLSLWKKMKGHSTDSTIYYQRFIPYFTQRAYDFTKQGQSNEYIQIWDELKDSVYTNWPDYGTGLRADIGIAAWNLEDKILSREIVDALIDNAIRNPDLGTYWRYNNQSSQNGYLGTLARITTLFVLHGESSLDTGITHWVLVNKMTNDWQQNPNVTSLMLSLLKMKGEWTTNSKTVVIRDEQERMLTGIGDANEVTLNAHELGSFKINHIDGPPIWLGIITRKEIQPEDQVTQNGDILHIQKIVTEAETVDTLKIGDQLTIRLKLTTDRDLDYVYIEDPLVPGMDPGISLSGFQWQYGLSYYQSFDPSSARFFIQHLPKGEYILEYKLGVVRSGQFRHPRTKIQSYFVPEINGFDQWKPMVKVYNSQ